MSSSLATLEAEALRLLPEERVRLADHLLASVAGDGEVEEAWAAEVQRRIAEVESGQTSLAPLEQAIGRASKTLA